MSAFTYASHIANLRRKRLEAQAAAHQTFSSVAEMDTHIRAFLDDYGLDLSETALQVLEYLARHSLRYIGVSWLAVPTIAEMVGVCERTIQRVLSRLEDLRIISRVTTADPDGKQSVNLVVIQPQCGVSASAELPEVSTVTADVTPDATHNLSPLALNLSESEKKKEEVKTYSAPAPVSEREKDFVKTAEERGIAAETAAFVLPFIRQILPSATGMTVRVALDKLADKLRTSPQEIVHIGAWLRGTLRNVIALNKAETAAWSAMRSR